MIGFLPYSVLAGSLSLPVLQRNPEIKEGSRRGTSAELFERRQPRRLLDILRRADVEELVDQLDGQSASATPWRAVQILRRSSTVMA
jgi:hypothetical protein